MIHGSGVKEGGKGASSFFYAGFLLVAVVPSLSIIELQSPLSADVLFQCSRTGLMVIRGLG